MTQLIWKANSSCDFHCKYYKVITKSFNDILDTDRRGTPDNSEEHYYFVFYSDLDRDGLFDYADDDRDGDGINGGMGKSHDSGNYCYTVLEIIVTIQKPKAHIGKIAIFFKINYSI